MNAIFRFPRLACVTWLAVAGLAMPAARAQSTPGAKLWEINLGGRISSSPAIDRDGAIYVGAGNYMAAVNADGREKWRFQAQGAVHTSPAVGHDGTIFFGSLDRKLYALTPAGALRWTYATGGPIYSSPAVDEEGTVYVGSDDFKLHAVGTNGHVKWVFPTGGYVRSSPSLGGNGAIYFGSWDTLLHALNRSGKELWSFETGHYIYSSPAVGADGTVYVGSVDKILYAIGPDGVKKWSFKAGSHIYSSPAIGPDGTIYFGSWDNKLYALSPAGTQKWVFATGNLVQSSPAVGSDGTIYFGSDENKIYAVNPDGTKRWSFATGSLVRSSPVLAGYGTIYCGSEDSNLYAIKISGGPAISPWPMFRAGIERRSRVQLIIANQPQNQLVSVGQPSSLSVSAAGAGPLRYQWHHNGAMVPGAGQNSLAFTNTQPAQAGEYHVVVTNSVESVTSASARLTVVVAPAIATPPKSQTNAAGSTVAFQVAAGSAGPMAYQWLFQGTNIAGATSPALALPEVARSQAGAYSVVVSNMAGAVTSVVATLVVVSPPEIVAQPQNQVSAIGAPISFSVAANSLAPMTYQWRLSGTNLPGANGPTLSLPNVQPSHAGSYSVVVSNLAGATTSGSAVLTVTLPPVITTQPKSLTGVVDRAVSMGVAANSAGPLAYRWFFQNALLGGATGNTLAFDKVQTSNAGAYFVVISNVAGVVTSAVADLAVFVPPAILTGPLSQTGTYGKSAVFTVTAVGTRPLDYTWRFNDTNLAGESGPTNLELKLNAIIPSQSGKYTVVISNSVGSVTSAPALLVVPRPPTVWERAKSWF